MYEPHVVKILTTEAGREQSTKPTDNTGRTRIEVNINALPYIQQSETKEDACGSTDSSAGDDRPGEFTHYLQEHRPSLVHKMPIILHKPQVAL